MKYSMIFLILPFILKGINLAYQKDPKIEFVLIFGSGFIEDTVSLKINGVSVIENVVLTSTKELGLVEDISLIKENDILKVYGPRGELLNSKPYKFSTQNHDTQIRIIVTINDLPYLFVRSIKKGKYILINKHSYYKNVTVEQYKRPLVFE